MYLNEQVGKIIIKIESIFKISLHTFKKRGICMIIDEFKSDSTLIKFDDRDIETKENNEDILNILVGLIIKKISEYS